MDFEKSFDNLLARRHRCEKDSEMARKWARSEYGGAAILKPDGRCCRLCSIKYTDPNIVSQNTIVKWGYPPLPDGRTSDIVCWYCLRVFEARYKFKVNIGALEQEMGKNTTVRGELKGNADLCRDP